ncbi:root UVB sensitive-like protein (Protein of unknown function, DUF647) [Carex rostrata]
MRVGLGQAQLLLSPSPSLSLSLFPSPSLRLHHLTLPSSPYPFLSSSSFPAICTTNNNFNYNSNTNHGGHADHGTGGINNNNNNGGGGWWPWNWNWNWNWEEEGGSNDNNNKTNHFLLLCLLFLLPCGGLALALANAESTILWEVSRDTRRKVLIGDDGCFVSVTKREDYDKYKQGGMPSYWWRQCRDTVVGLMLPHGYPHSVSADYMEYSLWRGVQGIASQVSGVLSTQALLYAVGLGKGAIPTAAAINWVLKDGIGYLSKILLSKFGRHFDVNPKGWRLFSDLLENAAYGMEIVTPLFPQYFVFIGAAAGAGRSAAALIQAATRSCFYAGFAVQRNFAEVIAKGEAQGMVSKFIGITLGIALANKIGSSAPLALCSYAVITAIHMYCNLKSYQSIQLRTLNPYRASLVFSEYLLSGQVPSVKEVNDKEPFFPSFPYITVCKGHSEILSSEAKDAAAVICRRLKLGCKLSEVINNKQDAVALFELFKDEGYILTQNDGKFCIILKEKCSTEDMLKSVFQVNYLYWLERNMGFEQRPAAEECTPGGMLYMSLDYVSRELMHAKRDAEQTGWDTHALIARPLPNRIRSPL